MVSIENCDCEERSEIKVDTMDLFHELQNYFERQVQAGVFVEEPPQEPYYIWHDSKTHREKKWYASKWYRCTVCGCLCEFNYPEFPIKGVCKEISKGHL